MFKKALLHLPLALILGVTLASAPAVAHVPGEVQLVTAGTGPWAEHTIRHGAGNWDRFNQLATGTDSAPSGLAAAIVNGELNLVYGLGYDSVPLFRTRLRIRHADGSWSDLSTPFDDPGQHSVAAVNGELHVVQQVSRSGFPMRHATRRADGSWKTYPTSVFPIPSSSAFAAVATNGTLEVLAAQGNSLWSTTLRADDTWTPAVLTTTFPAGFSASDLDVARVGADVHVLAKSSDGTMLHAVRRSTGAWTGWGDVGGETGVPGRIIHTAVTASKNTLQLAATTDTGDLFHAIRFENGMWQRFADVHSEAGGTASNDVAIAGD